MIFELKKSLLRREFRIVLLLVLFGMGLAAFRGVDGLVPEIAKICREKTAQYAGMPLSDVQSALGSEMETMGPAAESDASPLFCELCAVQAMYYSIDAFRAQDEQTLQLIGKLSASEYSTDFERRDAAQAIRMFDRRIYYIPCSRAELNAALNEADSSLLSSVPFLLLICTLLAPLFAGEYESGMYQILFSSAKGRAGLFRRKIAGGAAAVALVSLGYTALLYVVQWQRYGLSIRLLFASLQSAEAFAQCPYLLQVWQYLLLHAGMYLLCGLFLLGISAVCACFCKHSLTVSCICAGIAALLLLPPVLFRNHPEVMLKVKQTGLMQFLHPASYLTQYDSVNVLGFPFMQVTLAAAFTLLLTLLLIAAAYTCFTAVRAGNRKRGASC